MGKKYVGSEAELYEKVCEKYGEKPQDLRRTKGEISASGRSGKRATDDGGRSRSRSKRAEESHRRNRGRRGEMRAWSGSPGAGKNRRRREDSKVRGSTRRKDGNRNRNDTSR